MDWRIFQGVSSFHQRYQDSRNLAKWKHEIHTPCRYSGTGHTKDFRCCLIVGNDHATSLLYLLRPVRSVAVSTSEHYSNSSLLDILRYRPEQHVGGWADEIDTRRVRKAQDSDRADYKGAGLEAL